MAAPDEHPIKQRITSLSVAMGEGWSEEYTVGSSGITKIEACTKSGMYANLPYIRVWRGNKCHGEFCQHNIVGVYFEQEENQ